jgi:hypothetical protein
MTFGYYIFAVTYGALGTFYIFAKFFHQGCMHGFGLVICCMGAMLLANAANAPLLLWYTFNFRTTLQRLPPERKKVLIGSYVLAWVSMVPALVFLGVVLK